MADTKTILIAEDSSVILNLTKKILELQNYKILTAKNGGEVIKQVEKQKIDAILMDLNIPIKNGMECTREMSLFSRYFILRRISCSEWCLLNTSCVR